MSHAITMPALSDTMSNGRLVKWTKKPGDAIKKGDVIAEIETDKAVMDVEAFEDGYLSGPLTAEGTEAPVGEVIGYIADSAKDVLKRYAGDHRVTAACDRRQSARESPCHSIAGFARFGRLDGIDASLWRAKNASSAGYACRFRSRCARNARRKSGIAGVGGGAAVSH